MNKKIILKGDVFILRNINISDADNWTKWSKDKETMKYTAIEPMTITQEKKFIKNILKKKNDLTFAIIVNNIHIGGASLHLSIKQNRSGLGIVIGDKNYHNKGYGTKVVKLLLKYGFEKLKLNRIELGVFVDNKRAIKTYKRCGFKKEGLLKQHLFKKGKFYDEYMMAILKSEYFKKYKK